MRCPTVDGLAQYQMGACSARARARLQQHVATCARCREELRALERTATLVGTLPTPALPDDLWAGVAAHLQPVPRRVVMPWAWRVLAGAGVTASLLLGLTVTRHSTPVLPVASAASSSYVAAHQLLSAQDPLTDRASVGVLLASDGGAQ